MKYVIEVTEVTYQLRRHITQYYTKSKVKSPKSSENRMIIDPKIKQICTRKWKSSKLTQKTRSYNKNRSGTELQLRRFEKPHTIVYVLVEKPQRGQKEKRSGEVVQVWNQGWTILSLTWVICHVECNIIHGFFFSFLTFYMCLCNTHHTTTKNCFKCWIWMSSRVKMTKG